MVRCPIGTRGITVNKASRPTLDSTYPRTEWVMGALSPGVKQPGRKSDHKPLSSDEIKNDWSYISLSPYSFVACARETLR
jgi:hypothetical protein